MIGFLKSFAGEFFIILYGVYDNLELAYKIKISDSSKRISWLILRISGIVEAADV